MLYEISQFRLNKQELIELHRGGSASHFVKLSEWEDESSNYFNRFFSKRVSDVICVPQKGDNVVEILKKWCEVTKKKNRRGALIVQNFNLLEHFNFLNATKYISGMPRSEGKPHSIYLVYNHSKHVILYLRTALADRKRNENLRKDIDMCRSDINLLVSLYQDELKSSGVKIVGLVITKSETQTFQLSCECCKIFVISRKIFDKLPIFLKWWEKFELWIDIPETNLSEVNPETYTKFIMKILSLMACTKCTYLPNFTKSTTSQIEQTCLLLNPEQMDIIYSPYNFLILKGNFGTGKSIIIQKKLENIANLLQKNEIIYFVNYNPKSNARIGFESFIRKNIYSENLCKIKIIGNKMNLKLSGIFDMVMEKNESPGVKSVHLFIDEYNGEDLTMREVQLVKEKLQGTSLFKNSVVFIAVQPIEKERIDSFEHSHETYRSKVNRFQELEDIFQIEELTYVMRTTVQINCLVELAQDFLETKQNEFIHPNTYDTELAPLSISNSGSRNTDLQNPRKESFGILEYDSNILGNTSESTESNTVTTISETRKTIEVKGLVDLDEAFKEVAQSNMKLKRISKSKTVSSYKYMKESKIGHQIESLTPKVFRFSPFKDDFKDTISLAAVLDVVDIDQRKTVILHFEQKPPLNLVNALDFYPYSVTFDVEAFFHKKSQVSVLVTNFLYIRGMEFENVIIVINSSEYYLRHYFPEAITRCTKSLSIIVVEDNNLSKKDSLNEVITLWENQLPAVVEKWAVEQCEKCKRKSDYYCIQENGDKKVVYINTLSDEYRQLKKRFDHGKCLREEFQETIFADAAQM